MNPNELRIGNRLDYGAHGAVSVVEAKASGRIKIKFHLKESHEMGYFKKTVHISMLDPIPITPEWLERCGFKNEGVIGKIGYANEWEGPNDFIIWQLKEPANSFEYFGSEWTHGKAFQNVHQLQNLYFALTGEELQIKEI